MNVQKKRLVITLVTGLLVISQLATADPDQEKRKACTTPLASHGDKLKQGNLSSNDLEDIKALAEGGLVNYQLLQKKSFALIGTDYSNNVLTPTVVDSFTGKDIKDCTSNNCGLAKITPIPGSADFDKQLMVKNAIDAAKALTEPLIINQSVTRSNGRSESVPVQYTVIVQATHPGSVCYTYYLAGKIKQYCF